MYKQHLPPHTSIFMFSLCSAHTDLDTGWSQQGWLNTGTGCPEIRRDFKHWRYLQPTWSRPWVIWAYLKVRSSQVSRKPGATPRELLGSLSAAIWGTSLLQDTLGTYPAPLYSRTQPPLSVSRWTALLSLTSQELSLLFPTPLQINLCLWLYHRCLESLNPKC